MIKEVGRSEYEDNCVQISSRLWKKRYQNAKTRFSVPPSLKKANLFCRAMNENTVLAFNISMSLFIEVTWRSNGLNDLITNTGVCFSEV